MLLEPDSGERVLGSNVRSGYLSQDVDRLDYNHYNRTALENLQSTGAQPTDIFHGAKNLILDEQALLGLPGQLSRGQRPKLGFAMPLTIC